MNIVGIIFSVMTFFLVLTTLQMLEYRRKWIAELNEHTQQLRKHGETLREWKETLEFAKKAEKRVREYADVLTGDRGFVVEYTENGETKRKEWHPAATTVQADEWPEEIK